MPFESLFSYIENFMYSLSPIELVLIAPFILGFLVVTALGFCLAITFYRWTLRDEDEEEDRP